jgi:hypothetical protein
MARKGPERDFLFRVRRLEKTVPISQNGQVLIGR